MKIWLKCDVLNACINMRNVTTFDYNDFEISSTSLSSLLFSMLLKSSVSRRYNFYPGRFQKRSADVSCDDIDKNPREACEMYHFRCQACANDTILLQHSKTIFFIKSYWHRNIEPNEFWTKVTIKNKERERNKR